MREPEKRMSTDGLNTLKYDITNTEKKILFTNILVSYDKKQLLKEYRQICKGSICVWRSRKKIEELLKQKRKTAETKGTLSNSTNTTTPTAA